MRTAAPSRLTTTRLSVYLRCLTLLEASGTSTVSSRDLAHQFHLNSAQIRKDLATFGEFGVRGFGYDVSHLKAHLVRILGLDKQYRVIIVGAGNLGTALASYGGFNSGEFRIVGLFDRSRQRLKSLATLGFPAHPMSALRGFVKRERVDIAVLAVPASAGQKVFDQVTGAGIRAVLNFVPIHLRVPAGIELSSVDLKVQMENLAYHLKICRGAGAGETNPGAMKPRTPSARSRRHPQRTRRPARAH